MLKAWAANDAEAIATFDAGVPRGARTVMAEPRP